MMEKFHDDADEYSRRHTEAWHGRTFGAPGAAVGGTMETFSPTGIWDMGQNPGMFNLMKMGTLPALHYGASVGVGFITGEKIGFTHRLLHSMDMTFRTYRWGFQTAGATAGRAAMFAIRRTPGMIATSAVLGAGLWLQSLYYDMSGMYIGDIRFNR